MDPQATLHDLLDAYYRNDREAIDDALNSLRVWNLSGGFAPTITRPVNNDPAVLAVYRRQPQGVAK